jgi:Dolichyl-phosphate-mannose-protein mannosyltransferase
MPVSKKSKQHILIAALLIIALVVLGGIRILQYIKSPDVLFLANRAGAQWIKYDSEFQLQAVTPSQLKCEFRYGFNADKAVDNARISVQALKQFQVVIDGVVIFASASEFDNWKQFIDIAVPFKVNAGPHEIDIIVTSKNSHPAVIAYSDTLPIWTDSGWLASIDGKSWQPAVPASQIKEATVSREFPAAVDALIKTMPYLAVVFAMVFIISLLGSLYGDKVPKLSKWWAEPPYVRLALLVLWAVLAANNMFKIKYWVGYDIMEHIEYIAFIVVKGSLPLATDGWQMNQAPLNYILSAPLYALLIKRLELPWVVQILRIIPIIAGLLQIEIVYRAAQLVFSQRKDLQIIAIVTGSLLPMHTYMCQVVGNEPLAGCFISLVVLFCMSLVMPTQKELRLSFFVLMGFVWGLALLSKMTAVLLAPVLIIVVLVHTRAVQRPLKSALMPTVTVFGFSILTAGWYYFRNYIEFGNPFPLVVGALSGAKQWWQDPSYRTWSQVLSFGQSLSYPVYAGVKGFWDGLYSTLWLDGFNSGLIIFLYRPPWNENFMAAGALLALLPSVFILTGVVAAGLNKTAVYRNAAVLSLGAIALFLAAMMDLYLRFPSYCIPKASYTLGLLPCYAILTAAGAEPFLRNRIVRSVAIAAFACWGFAAYTAYFVIGFQQWH